MIAKKKLPKSLRKYIRKEKARIRREVLDIKKQKELIQQLFHKFAINILINADDTNSKK